MKLSKELFDDVIVYRMSEIGAMGPNGTIKCFKSNGKSFDLNYLSDETPWEDVKKNFEAINGCRFDGPTMAERPFVNMLVIGGDAGYEPTHVNPGWKHIWLDYGNHLVCKEEYFAELRAVLEGFDNCEITFDWDKILRDAKFVDKLESAAEEYRIQKEWDDEFTKKLEELNRLPEYREKISRCKRENGIDGMLAVLKEYGVEVSALQIKQYGFRRQGLV